MEKSWKFDQAIMEKNIEFLIKCRIDNMNVLLYIIQWYIIQQTKFNYL